MDPQSQADRLAVFDEAAAAMKQEQVTGLRSSLLQATTQTPDRAAEVIRLADRNKLPTDVVDRNFDLIKSKDAAQNTPYDRILTETPGLADFLRQPEHAALAKDDLDQMGYLHWLATAPKQALDRGRANVELSHLQTKSIFTDLNAKDLARVDELKAQIQANGGPLGTHGFWSPRSTALSSLAEVLPQLTSVWTTMQVRALEGASAAALLTAAGTGGLGAPLVLPAAGVGAALGGLEGGLEEGFKLFAGPAYEHFRTVPDELGHPLSPAVAKGAAIAVGALNAGLAPFLVGTVTKLLPGTAASAAATKLVTAAVQSPVARSALGQLAVTYTGQMTKTTLAMMGQQAVQIVVGDLAQKASGQPFKAIDPVAQLKEVAESGVAALQSFAIVNAAGPGTQLLRDLNRSQEAVAAKTYIEARGKAVEQSATFQRSPEKMHQYLESLAPDATVNLPVESFVQYWQSKGADPAQKATELTGDPKALANALVTHEDLSVPAARYDTLIGATEHATFFNDEVRLQPAMMNAREAAAFSDEQKTAFDKDIEALAAEEAGKPTVEGQTPEQRTAASVLAVAEAVQKQSAAAGYDRAAAEAHGALLSARFGQLASVLKVDPLALFQKYGLQLERPLLERAAAGPGVTELTQRYIGEPVEGTLRPEDVQTLTEKGYPVDGKTPITFVGWQETGDPAQPFYAEYRIGAYNFSEMSLDKLGVQRPAPPERKTELYQSVPRETPKYAGPERRQASAADQGISERRYVELLKRFGGTQEAQPALPGAEEVRQQEIPTPTFEAPFSLTGEPVKGKAGKQDLLFQTEGTGGDRRASIRWGADRQFTIELGPKANLSSFLHESGHLFLETFGDAADQLTAVPEADRTSEQAALLKDYATLLKRLGVEDRAGLGTAQHEQFAKEFEAYLREGKAPMVALRPAFARFRAWLMSLYTDVRSQLGVQLNDEIRGVFDRMLASEDAIQQAEGDAPIRPIWATQEESKLNPQEWAAYQKTLQDAHESRVNQLQSALIKEWDKEQTAFWSTQRTAMRETVVSELSQEPAYIALAALRKNQRPDGTPLPDEIQTGKLDLATLEAHYGKAKPDAPTMTKAERAELEKIHAEMDSQPFVKRTWLVDEHGRQVMHRQFDAKGRVTAEIPFAPGAAGAPVYWDIADKGPEHPPSRSVITAAIEKYLMTGKGIWGERALEVARDRLPKDASTEPYVAPTADWVAQLKRKGLVQKDGIAPDVAAERFGYDSGDALVQVLLEAPAWTTAVETETERRMRANFGNPQLAGGLADEAQATIVNDGRSKVVAAELQALAKQRRPSVVAGQAARKAITAGVPTIAHARAAAQSRVGSLTVAQLLPTRFEVAARVASREAFDAAQKQDVETAISAKTRELVAVETARAVREAGAAVDQAVTDMKGMFQPDAKLAKSRNMDFVVAARNIAAAYLYPVGATKRAMAVADLQKIERYDNLLYDHLKDAIDEATLHAQSYKNLTVDQFTAVRDTVMSLWTSARRSEQIRVAGVLKDRETVRDGLLPVLAGRGIGGVLGAGHRWSRAEMDLLSVGAALKKVEHYLSALDKNDPNGPMQAAIYLPVKDGETALRLQSPIEMERFVEAMKGVEDTLTHQKIAAPEVGYTFKDMDELLGMIGHTGNKSNKEKLVIGNNTLLGGHWGSIGPDGELDSTPLDTLIERLQRQGVLTKAHYELMGKIGAQFEDLKPALQRAYKERFGAYWPELPLETVTTPWGEQPGWYMPARVDPLKVTAEIRGGLAGVSDGGEARYALPAVGHGALKARVEGYNKPLTMSLSLVPSHLNWALRFIHLENPVADVGRLLRDPQLKAAFDATNPRVVPDLLLPWLARSAKQVVSRHTEGAGGAFMDKTAKMIRERTTQNALSLNAVNVMHHSIGLVQAALTTPPTDLAMTLWDWMRDSAGLAKYVTDKSDYMAGHASAKMAEQREILNDLLVRPSSYQSVREWGQKHGMFFSRGMQNAVDNIAWKAHENWKLRKGLSPEEAVISANAQIRLVQGAYGPSDVANFEASTPTMRLFSMYYGKFLNDANLWAGRSSVVLEQYGLTPRAVPQLAVIAAMTAGIPGILYSGFLTKMTGGSFRTPEEEAGNEYIWPFLKFVLGSTEQQIERWIPFSGLARGFEGAFNNQTWDDDIRLSPALTTEESLRKGVHSLWQQYEGWKLGTEAPPLDIRDTMTLIGVASGFPLGALGKPAQYVHDVSTGKAPPPNTPIEAGQGLISGRGQPHP